MASARTVAVVVPSPATSLVLDATSLTMRAPMFSYLSSSSISLATVTPSLETVGEPKLFWRMTLRPLGPSVTLTARASLPMPRRIASRASWSNAICLAAILPPLTITGSSWSLVCGPSRKCRRPRSRLLVEHGQHVLLAHEEDVVAAGLLEFVAGPVGEQDGVALLDLERAPGAILEEAAGPDREDLPLLRL